MALFPLGQATVNGLYSMFPLQASPTHPTSIGDTICTTASYPEPWDIGLGIATRYLMTLSSL